MVLRKITADNSVRFIPKSEQPREIKQNTIKNRKQSEQIQPNSGGDKPNTKKQNKKISQNSKKNSLQMWQQVDLVSLIE